MKTQAKNITGTGLGTKQISTPKQRTDRGFYQTAAGV